MIRWFAGHPTAANLLLVLLLAAGLFAVPGLKRETFPDYLPGEVGNAVIAGHVNRPDLSPAPFWNLHLVQKGDKIIVQPLNGKALTFVVTSVTWISAYAKGSGNTTLGAVFGPASTPNLNLLTCIGDWDGHTFDHRLFVQAQLSGPAPFTQP